MHVSTFYYFLFSNLRNNRTFTVLKTHSKYLNMREQEGIQLFMILKNNKSQCDKKIALVMIVSTPIWHLDMVWHRSCSCLAPLTTWSHGQWWTTMCCLMSGNRISQFGLRVGCPNDGIFGIIEKINIPLEAKLWDVSIGHQDSNHHVRCG